MVDGGKLASDEEDAEKTAEEDKLASLTSASTFSSVSLALASTIAIQRPSGLQAVA